MLSSLFRPRKGRRPIIEHSPYSSANASPVAERSGFFRPEASAIESHTVESQAAEDDDDDDEDDGGDTTPLLPIFSAAHLDTLPVYAQTHALRAEIVSRCDTILTWEQLRTPQVSSFVVKPILANVLRNSGGEKLSRGIIYSLMANCLQFRKEADENMANLGVSRTRALLAELLAIKLLKEFSHRELIDALSYDFYPLQGMPPPTASSSGPIASGRATPHAPPRASRISALEVAIRAQAKKFLSNALVMQHLDAIWAGNVVFHSAYDQMHRHGSLSPGAGYFRRTATIYDGRDASLFKLSRLRVPRYRHITGTVSLVVLMLLHLMVLSQRAFGITALEIVFWIWSLGFMMDEIAGFNEAGVSLYFMSLWNTFDMGIFLLFTTFYVLRIVGLIMPETEHAHRATAWSFDVLASCAVFLYPRIFSVLDHFRYFSQLIIAFRIMAVDMIALLILIVVACSGFFVAFTFSFARDYYSARDVSYHLFQILLGFTPAAWDSWPKYNLLGKFLLVAFLIICHFLIVTILITVLTNSFAAVAANAQEEHQFLVAVNTISLVKNDSLFSYVAPTNLFAWVLHPFRWCMSFRRFVRLNRTVIKVTHFPLLFTIYFYEKTALRNSIFETNEGFSSKDTIFKELSNTETLHPVMRRLRRESIGSQQQERALDEVFRKPYRTPTIRTQNVTGSKVDSWMNGVLASPPTEMGDGGSRRMTMRRGGLRRIRDGYGTMQRQKLPLRDFSAARSVISDPEDFATTHAGDYSNLFSEAENMDARTEDDDADNEDNNEEDNNDDEDLLLPDEEDAEGKGSTPKLKDFAAPAEELAPSSVHSSSALAPPARTSVTSSPRHSGQTLTGRRSRPTRFHSRKASSSTILFNPPMDDTTDADDIESTLAPPRKAGQRTPGNASSGGRKTPRPGLTQQQPIVANAHAHPLMPMRQAFQSVPNLSGLDQLASRNMREHRRPSSVVGDYADDDNFAAIPSSFATQMAMATNKGGHSDLMLSRLLLARLGALEDSFKDVKEILKEVKRLRKKDKDASEEEKRGRASKRIGG